MVVLVRDLETELLKFERRGNCQKAARGLVALVPAELCDHASMQFFA